VNESDKVELAIVAYTKEPEKVKNHAVSNGWFEDSEIIAYSGPT
jgi:hypothetical protein